MDTKHLQLKGNNLNNIDCVDRNSIIHPETCIQQVLTSNSNNQSLEDWITTNPSTDPEAQPFDIKGGLKEWLNTYHSMSTELPTATDEIKGGVKVGQYLTMSGDNNDVLNVDKAALNIPEYTEYSVASYNNLGLVHLGNDLPIQSDFGNGGDIEQDGEYQKFPLRLDKSGRAGVVISYTDFQPDWNQASINAKDFIKNKPTIPAAQIQSDWNQTDNTSKDFIKNKPTIPSANTAGDGIDITNNVISQEVATSSTIGGIKIGYTKNGNKKPVQINIDSTSANYLKAFVDTEQHLTVGGMITNGLSAHFYRVGTGGSAGNFTPDNWIPIFMSVSNNIGKCSVEFEILGREDGKTSYGKYYVNHMSNTTNKLLCLSFYSEDTNHFDYNDIRAAKYAVDNNNVTIVVYKKVKNVTDSMFIVNVLAENDPVYSVQHYFYTSANNKDEEGYLLTNSDLRIGTFNSENSKITAKLVNNASAPSQEMNTILATNATCYTTT